MDKGKKPMMEEGNTSNPNAMREREKAIRDMRQRQKAIRDEIWPKFDHYPANTNEIKKGDYCARCRICHHTFKHNIYEDDGIEFSISMHYNWHMNGGEERDGKNRLRRMLSKPKPKNVDWYKDYYKEPEPITLQTPTGKPYSPPKTHWIIYEKIYKFRGDHTVSCTSCGQVLNYKENILRDHYDAHQRQAEREQEARDRESRRVIEERKQEAMREKKHRERLIQEENTRKWREWQIQDKKREEERRIAASRMAEIERQEADAAFWNEAAQMADNTAVSQQQQNEQEDEEPWWDEILQYVDSQNL